MAYSVTHDANFWQNAFGAKNLDDWCFYGYEYLDDLNFMLNASKAFSDWADGGTLLEHVGKKFLEMGWDGEGEMQILWFPPFLNIGVANYFGGYALHVKQFADGISWIACPFEIPEFDLGSDVQALE